MSWSGEEPGELSSGRELGGSEAMMGRLLACHAAGLRGRSRKRRARDHGRGQSRVETRRDDGLFKGEMKSWLLMCGEVVVEEKAPTGLGSVLLLTLRQTAAWCVVGAGR